MSSAARKPLWKRRWFTITVSLVLVVALAYQIRWHDVREFIGQGDPWLILLILLFYPLDRIFMAWKWRLLILAQDTRIGLWASIRIYLASSAAGQLLPIGGAGPDMIRVGLLKYEGLPASLSVPSIIVERVAGVLGSLLMLATGAVIALFLLGPMWFSRWDLDWPMFAVIIGGMLAAAVIVGWFVAPIVAKLVASRAGGILQLPRQIEVLKSYLKMRALLALSVALSWLEQWAAVIAFFLACKAFGVELSFLACAAIVPLATILERLPISFGGIGLREAGIVLMAIPFGVSQTDAFLVSMANFTLYLVSLLPMSLLYFVGRPVRTDDPVLLVRKDT